MKYFHHKLQQIINDPAANEVYKSVVKTLIEHLDHLDKLSIEKLAQLSFTSTATISRFVKSLGYPNFIALKEDAKTYKTCRRIEMNDNCADIKFDGAHDGQILDRYLDGIGQSLRDLKGQVDFAAIDRINEKIHASRSLSIYAVLFPGFISAYYQLSMLYIGKYCEYHDLADPSEALSPTPADLALFFSVDGNFVEANKKLVVQLKSAGTQLILVTQNPRINLINAFDEVLYMGACDSAKSGRYKLVVFSELLLSRYYSTYYADEIL